MTTIPPQEDREVSQYATLAQMRLDLVDQKTNVIMTRGTTTEGDGPMVFWKRDASGSETSGDGASWKPYPLASGLDGWLTPSQFAMVADASTDQSAAFQAMLTASRDEGGTPMFLTPADLAYYVETRSYYWNGCGPLIGAGRGSWVHNPNADPAVGGEVFWDQGVLNVGTYLGHVPTGSVDGVHNEAAYELDPITEGDETATLVTAGDASNFTVGDIVAVMDPNTYGSTTFERAACLTEITKITSGVLTVAHPFKDSYTANGGTKVSIRVLNTGDVLSTLAPGAPALEIAINPIIGRLRMTQAATYYGEVFHLNAYNGQFFDLDIEGAQAIGGNPIAFTTFDRVRAGGRYRGAEFAYLSNDCAMNDCEIRRIGDGQGGLPNATPGSQPLFSLSETGGDWSLNNLRVYNWGFAGDSGQASVNIAKPRVHLKGGSTVNSTGSGVHVGGTTDGTFDDRGREAIIEGHTVIAPETDGIDVRAKGSRLIGNRIIGTPTGRVAIRIASYVAEAEVRDNDMKQDDGTSAAQDRVEHGDFGGSLGTGAGIRAFGNRSIFTHDADETVGNPILTATNTGYATEAEAYTYPLPAASTMRKQGFDVEFSGTMANSTGNRRFGLTWGGVGVNLGGQIEVLAAGGTGAWKLVARVHKVTDALVRATITLTTTAGVQVISGTDTTNTATTAHDLGLNLQILSAGDTISISDAKIVPFNDQLAT